MAYPELMQRSINILGSTRKRRRKEKVPFLPPSQKEELLKKYHPDYREGVSRRLRLGVNKGERVPNELADLLEGESLIQPDEIDLNHPKYKVDVLVIGGGGAGASAALIAGENEADVLLVTKLRFGDSNTIMSEGGIQAATSQHDSPALHYLDTMGGGGFCNIPQLVKVLVNDAPEVTEWLIKLGVMFDRNPDGNLYSAFAGGQCRRRVHFAKDYTGMEIMRVLRDEVYNRGIEVFDFSPAIELLLDEEGKCAGAILMNIETGEKFIVQAKTTILATGGIGRLHMQSFPTTNHYGATGCGVVMANRIGAKIIFMDAIQFHPTGTAYPEAILGLLVSEAFRGWGAHLVNSQGRRFINELHPRDVTSSATIREVVKRGMGVKTPTGMEGVWLDTSLVDIIHGSGTIKRVFPHLHHRFQTFDIDITKEPVLVYPTIHYQNGGILCNTEGETNIKNLFVAGEVSGGVHGRNRLGGNSLLDIFVFGRRAGKAAAIRAKDTKIKRLTLEHVRKYQAMLKDEGIKKKIKSPLLLPDYRYEKALTRIYK